MKLKRFHIDYKDLEKVLKRIENYKRRDKIITKRLDCLKLTYENDLLNKANRCATLNKVFSHFGLPSVITHTNLRKIAPKKVSELVENYPSIALLLKGSHYEKFLD